MPKIDDLSMEEVLGERSEDEAADNAKAAGCRPVKVLETSQVIRVSWNLFREPRCCTEESIQ